MNKLTEKTETRIIVDEEYSIGADFYSWHLARKRKRKGQWVWEPFQWYSSLEKAGQALFELKARLSGAQGCAELLRAVTESRNLIQRALQSFFELWGRYE